MSPLHRKKLLSRLEPASGSGRPGAHHQTQQERASAWTTLAFVVLVLTICVAPNFMDTLPKAPIGSAWPHADMVSPYNLVLPDAAAAESQRKRLEANHQKVFIADRRLEKEIINRSKTLLAFLKSDKSTSDTNRLDDQVRQQFDIELQESTLATLKEHAGNSRTASDLETIFHHLMSVRGVSGDKSLLNSAIRSDRALVLTVNEQQITSPSLRMVLGYPDEAFGFTENAYLQTFRVSPELKAAYADVVRQLLRPNISYSPEKTEQRLVAALAAINPQLELTAGSVIIRNGEVVSPETIAALHMLDMRERQNDFLRLLGGFIIVIMTVTFTGLYARRFNRDLLFTSRSVLMVALPVVLAVSLGRLIVNLGGGALLGAFAMPAGMVGILTVMLFDERFAFVLTTMACVLFATSTGLGFPYTMMGLVGGYTAIASLRNLQERREVLFTGLYIALANCLMALAVGLIMHPSRADLGAGLLAGLMAGMANGIVCYMLAVSSLPVFENWFQVTTDVRLLELTGANNKLLKLMEEKAPGTLHHSMNVTSLAEAAAEAVGAHYLLVRAGAHFHDIGKMMKPTYFTENQSTPEQKQVHSKLSPAMSTLIIKNHVKDGVELARAHRLPERVIDFIPEHHGTTLIKYFYVQALKKAEQEGSDEIISEDEYRYPGPKPRSVETAILMLADSVEAIATSRFSGKNPDEVEIRRAVHEAVTEKYEDRQLSNSPLTFRDLEIIKDSFVRILQNRFHQRVKYPTMPGKGPAQSGDRQSSVSRKGEDGASRKGDDGTRKTEPEGTTGSKAPEKRTAKLAAASVATPADAGDATGAADIARK